MHQNIAGNEAGNTEAPRNPVIMKRHAKDNRNERRGPGMARREELDSLRQTNPVA